MACEYTSAIEFSKHNAKTFADAYSKEERSALSQHLKELKASKQYKSVRLFFPGENTELYYEVTNSDGKKGLLYSTISSQNEIKDTLLVPMQYYGFAVMPSTTGKEPYIAYNAQRTFTRPTYFDHGHEETVILASLTPKVNQWDIYGASHLSNYKSAMTCFRMLSNIQDNSTNHNGTRIIELERKIHTYEGLLSDAQEFKRKCEIEHSNYLRQAISDVNKYERIIQECKNEINSLKAGHQWGPFANK